MGLKHYLYGTKKEIDANIEERVKTTEDIDRHVWNWFTCLGLEAATAITLAATGTPEAIHTPFLIDVGWRILSPFAKGFYNHILVATDESELKEEESTTENYNLEYLKFIAQPGLVATLRKLPENIRKYGPGITRAIKQEYAPEIAKTTKDAVKEYSPKIAKAVKQNTIKSAKAVKQNGLSWIVKSGEFIKYRASEMRNW